MLADLWTLCSFGFFELRPVLLDLLSRTSLNYLSSTSVVFHWLMNERSRKRFSHTWLGVWVQVCGGFRSRGLCKVSVFVLLSAIA